MEKLGKYELYDKLSSQNSGYSVWGFGRRDGKNYFIKQFLSPKYPENDTVSSPERLAKKKKQCADFEAQKISVYEALNAYSDGNDVRVCDFFRVDSKYYITMPKVEAIPLEISDINAMGENEVCRLCAIIAHAIDGLHQGGVVHADLKHENILYTYTKSGVITAKVIDFDSSFLEANAPKVGEEIVGDLVYFSPEACKSIFGEEAVLTCKMDIFALGVLFHLYFTNELPTFNRENSMYPGEAVAKGDILGISPLIPVYFKDTLLKMLDPDPFQRPTAMDVYNVLIANVLPLQNKKTVKSDIVEGKQQAPIAQDEYQQQNEYYGQYSDEYGQYYGDYSGYGNEQYPDNGYDPNGYYNGEYADYGDYTGYANNNGQNQDDDNNQNPFFIPGDL